MLEMSREEIRKKIPDDIHGLNRFFRSVVFVVDQYIYEPIATSLRFLHLVIIFVPVIVTIPVIWFGGRKKDRDNERAGTLWWYGFLVTSMERAGPAFIKVSH
jgi:aarF domain-containing kinase